MRAARQWPAWLLDPQHVSIVVLALGRSMTAYTWLASAVSVFDLDVVHKRRSTLACLPGPFVATLVSRHNSIWKADIAVKYRGGDEGRGLRLLRMTTMDAASGLTKAPSHNRNKCVTWGTKRRGLM